MEYKGQPFDKTYAGERNILIGLSIFFKKVPRLTSGHLIIALIGDIDFAVISGNFGQFLSKVIIADAAKVRGSIGSAKQPLSNANRILKS